MTSIAATTCDLHRHRPATARCPGCQRYFCGECITEHNGRLSCAGCLAAARSVANDLLANEEISRPAAGRKWLVSVSQLLLGLALCWSMYYALGRLLMAIPADFHDGTLWQE